MHDRKMTDLSDPFANVLGSTAIMGASDEMIVFVVMNTAAMRLVPTTVAALRGQYGSAEPMSVMLPTLLTTLCAMTVAIAAAKIGCRITAKRRAE